MAGRALSNIGVGLARSLQLREERQREARAEALRARAESREERRLRLSEEEVGERRSERERAEGRSIIDRELAENAAQSSQVLQALGLTRDRQAREALLAKAEQLDGQRQGILARLRGPGGNVQPETPTGTTPTPVVAPGPAGISTAQTAAQPSAVIGAMRTGFSEEARQDFQNKLTTAADRIRATANNPSQLPTVMAIETERLHDELNRGVREGRYGEADVARYRADISRSVLGTATPIARRLDENGIVGGFIAEVEKEMKDRPMIDEASLRRFVGGHVSELNQLNNAFLRSSGEPLFNAAQIGRRLYSLIPELIRRETERRAAVSGEEIRVAGARAAEGTMAGLRAAASPEALQLAGATARAEIPLAAERAAATTTAAEEARAPFARTPPAEPSVTERTIRSYRTPGTPEHAQFQATKEEIAQAGGYGSWVARATATNDPRVNLLRDLPQLQADLSLIDPARLNERTTGPHDDLLILIRSVVTSERAAGRSPSQIAARLDALHRDAVRLRNTALAEAITDAAPLMFELSR